MKKILLFVMLATTIVSGCKEKVGKIEKATKSVVYPGIPRAKITIHYVATVVLFKDIHLLEIKIKRNNNEEFQLKNISIVAAKSGKIMKSESLLPAGKYFMEAHIPYSKERENSKDKMIILLSDDNTTYKYVVDILKKEPVIHS